MIGVLADPGLERWSRRPAWTCGERVELADGSTWHLPRIDEDLLVRAGGLIDDIQDALDVATGADDGAAGCGPLSLAEIRYHAQMAVIGTRLLQANYDLTAGCWKRLWAFDDLAAMFALTGRIASVLAASAEVWGPILAERTPDRLPVVLPRPSRERGRRAP